MRQAHLVQLVVCSRSTEYEALVTRLKLQTAVVVQPLSPDQIDDYLAGADTEAIASFLKTIER